MNVVDEAVAVVSAVGFVVVVDDEACKEEYKSNKMVQYSKIASNHHSIIILR